MDKDAWIDITVCVDVQVSAAGCYASADIPSVILEVHHEQRVIVTEVIDASVYLFSLLRIRKQGDIRVISDRHVVEVPDEEDSELNQLVQELCRGDGVIVLAGIAGRDSVEQLSVVQPLHRFDDAVVDTLAAAAVGCLLKALKRDGRNKVLYADHVIGEFIVDQCPVGEAQEDTVTVLFAQTDNILLSDEGFAAGIDVHIDTEFFTLTDEVVDLLVGKVQLVAVFRGPAACAVKIAGGSRIQQNGPGNVAVILLTKVFLDLPPLQVDVEKEVVDDGLDNVALHIKQYVPDIRIVGMLRFTDGILDCLDLAGKMTAGKLVNGFHDFHHVLLRILVDEVNRLTQTEFSKAFFDIHMIAPKIERLTD